MLPFTIVKFDSGEDANFAEQLYLKYKSLMNYIANKYISDRTLAEDLVSDSVVKIIKNINTLKGYNYVDVFLQHS